jgi:hypothetical protein
MLTNIERWAVIAQLVKDIRDNRGWAGETHIQKILFFLQELLNVPGGYRFVLYKHGPYSFDFHDDLARMLSNFILSVEPRPGYGPSFGLGETGDNVIDRGTKVVAQYQRQLQFIVGVLGTKDVRTLERYGTALLLRSKYPGFDDATLGDKIVELKPHITTPLANEAVRAVAEIEDKAKAEGLIEQ